MCYDIIMTTSVMTCPFGRDPLYHCLSDLSLTHRTHIDASGGSSVTSVAAETYYLTDDRSFKDDEPLQGH